MQHASMMNQIYRNNNGDINNNTSHQQTLLQSTMSTITLQNNKLIQPKPTTLIFGLSDKLLPVHPIISAHIAHSNDGSSYVAHSRQTPVKYSISSTLTSNKIDQILQSVHSDTNNIISATNNNINTARNICFNLLMLKIKLFGVGRLNEMALRIITIPNFYRFSHLHDVMVFLFKWNDKNSHCFQISRKTNIWFSDNLSFSDDNGENKDEYDVPLSFGFKKESDFVQYAYNDSVNGWHAKIDVIDIETITLKNNDMSCIKIIGGRGGVNFDQEILNVSINKNIKFRKYQYEYVGNKII